MPRIAAAIVEVPAELGDLVEPVAGRRLGHPRGVALDAVLARLRGLRGTAFDVFAYSGERRREHAVDDGAARGGHAIM